MKKQGFTLPELLITMAVIALVAAMTAPVISSLLPDANKGKILKIYNTITDINKELLSDPGYNFIPREQDSITAANGCEGLNCTDEPPVYEKYRPEKFYTYPSKYVNLLADFLELREPIENKNHFGKTEFYTADGIKWKTDTDAYINYFITLDLDDSANSKNCKYDKDECTNPDQFEFFVSKEGMVFPNDPLTNAYIKNSSKLNDKKADFQMAKEDVTVYRKTSDGAPSIKLY